MQRFQCLRCGKSFSESQPLQGIRLETDKAVQIVELLSETVGIRAAARLARVDLATVLRVLESAGEHCARFIDAKVRNINVPIVVADEVFGYCQQKPNFKNEDDETRGSMWTFLAIAKHEKLIITYRVAKRKGDEAIEFLKDIRSRMACRFQFNTDGFKGYVGHGSSGNVEDVLGDCCDYATETKIMRKDKKFSGARIFFAPYLVTVKRKARFGNPDMTQATTAHAERTNLSLRTFNRRLVRCTINFSKKRENHEHATALFAAVFNYCRVHKSLEGRTPAMAAGLTNHVWTVAELLSATI